MSSVRTRFDSVPQSAGMAKSTLRAFTAKVSRSDAKLKKETSLSLSAMLTEREAFVYADKKFLLTLLLSPFA